MATVHIDVIHGPGLDGGLRDDLSRVLRNFGGGAVHYGGAPVVLDFYPDTSFERNEVVIHASSDGRLGGRPDPADRLARLAAKALEMRRERGGLTITGLKLWISVWRNRDDIQSLPDHFITA